MSYEIFEALHNRKHPLLLTNIWNAHSAKIAQDSGAKALGTSSHAISNAIGLEDGNNLSFDQLMHFIRHIMKVATVPVSVDMESGYSSDPKVIAGYLKQLAEVGVVGVNIEDSETVDGKRTLKNAASFAAMMSEVRKILKSSGLKMFMNFRTDTYVTKHEDALKETIKRGVLYKEAGANGLFVPLITTAEDIKEVVSKVALPLNVFLKKDGPGITHFTEAGVHRISSGDAAYAKVMNLLKDIYTGFNKAEMEALF